MLIPGDAEPNPPKSDFDLAPPPLRVYNTLEKGVYSLPQLLAGLPQSDFRREGPSVFCGTVI
jgi:hypothetical protein